VKKGWSCELQGDIDDCSEICGDGRVVGDEKCDDETLRGCSEDCITPRNGWICLGGDEDTKTTCELECRDPSCVFVEVVDVF